MEIIQHLDMLKRPIGIGDCVAFPAKNYAVDSIHIGVVSKLTEKMVSVNQIIPTRKQTVVRKYSNVLLILNSSDITMHLLKTGNK